MNVVESNGQGLADVVTGLVAQILGKRQALGILAFERTIGTALEQVVIEDELDNLVIPFPFDAVPVVSDILNGAQVDLGLVVDPTATDIEFAVSVACWSSRLA